MCDGIRASERANYLANEGMTHEMARQVVMREFPCEFPSGGGFAGGAPKGRGASNDYHHGTQYPSAFAGGMGPMAGMGAGVAPQFNGGSHSGCNPYAMYDGNPITGGGFTGAPMGRNGWNLPLEQEIENDSFGHVLKALKKVPGLVHAGENKVVFPQEYRTWQRIRFNPDTFGHVLKALLKEAGAVHLGGPHILVPGTYLEMKFEPDTFGHVLTALQKEVKAVGLGDETILVPRQYVSGPPQTIEPDTFGHVVRDLQKAGCSHLGGAQVLLPQKLVAWRRVPFQQDSFGHNLKDLTKQGALYLGGNEVLMR